MKTSRRQELRTNELILELLKIRDYVEQNWQIVVGALVVVALIFGGAGYWRYSKGVKQAEGLNAVTAAGRTPDTQDRVDKLFRLADEYTDEVVVLAALQATTRDALAGLMIASTTKDANMRENLMKRVEEAGNRIIRDFPGKPDAVAHAHLDLAAVAENRFQKDEARKHYKAILDTPALAAVSGCKSVAAKRESMLDAVMTPVEILPALPTSAPAIAPTVSPEATTRPAAK